MNLSPRWAERLRAEGHDAFSALALCAEELDAGALVTVDATRTRVHLLPLPFRHPL